ncbi:MAG: SRPBCC family protein [Ignavibacteria bacterium]
MKTHVHEKVIVIDKSLNEVFGFFSKAENLNRITPPALGFNIKTPLPIKMKAGTIIEYTIRLNGLKILWRSEITKWDPPYSFEDTQIKGPYKIWVHEHKFENIDGKTKMTDTIKYLSPGGIFEFIPHNLFVKRKVESIFEFREKILKDIFP